MYVCLFVCFYVCIYVCMYAVYIFKNVCIIDVCMRIPVCTFVLINVCMYAKYVYMCICMYTYLCMYMNMCWLWINVCMYVCMYVWMCCIYIYVRLYYVCITSFEYRYTIERYFQVSGPYGSMGGKYFYVCVCMYVCMYVCMRGLWETSEAMNSALVVVPYSNHTNCRKGLI